jgi:hypothetical protein
VEGLFGTGEPTGNEGTSFLHRRHPEMSKRPQITYQLGWREWATLPDLGIDRIKCKLDTGARTSSLHACDMEEFVEGEKRMIAFVVYPQQRRKSEAIHCVGEMVDERKVKDSGGRSEKRPVIGTTLQVGSWSWPIELTLTNRDQMGFRMLLGRTALRKRFIVDPGLSFLADRKWSVSK